MEDYEYYKDEMQKGTIPVITGQKGMEENLLLGRMLTWLPRMLFKGISKLVKKLFHKTTEG